MLICEPGPKRISFSPSSSSSILTVTKAGNTYIRSHASISVRKRASDVSTERIGFSIEAYLSSGLLSPSTSPKPGSTMTKGTYPS